MRLLLLGKNGQLGWELQRALAPLGEVIALDRNSTDYCGDLTNLVGLAETIEQLAPTVVINAAAYTAVDKAESEQALAKQINTTAVSVIARSAERVGALLVHYSTDYVFNGRGDMPWRESDATGALNVYGQTKWEGEQAITRYCLRHLIFRTSWVYAAKGNNFPKSILKLASECGELSVINDQFGAPTGAELIADCTAHAILKTITNNKLFGIYHLVSSGSTSWYEYAKFVLARSKKGGFELEAKEVSPVPTESFPTVAIRPRNSRLDNTKFQQAFDLILPDWRLGLVRMLNEIV